MTKKEIEKQARFLARENREAEPGITKVYWFPHRTEVRLVELHPYIPPSGDVARPYYFEPRPEQHLPAPSGIVLIRPNEKGKVRLPESWGDWDDAVELGDEE